MKRFFGLLLICAFGAVLFAGCGAERAAIDPIGYKSIREGSEITEEDAEKIVDGKTTKDEVYLMFGKPSEVLEDGRVFAYNWIRGRKGNVASSTVLRI